MCVIERLCVCDRERDCECVREREARNLFAEDLVLLGEQVGLADERARHM